MSTATPAPTPAPAPYWAEDSDTTQALDRELTEAGAADCPNSTLAELRRPTTMWDLKVIEARQRTLEALEERELLETLAEGKALARHVRVAPKVRGTSARGPAPMGTVYVTSVESLRAIQRAEREANWAPGQVRPAARSAQGG